jgi:Tfp pilus assembly protein PilF
VWPAIVYLTVGQQAWVHHLVSIVLHVSVCVAVYALLARWFDSVPCLLGALLFALHPVHSEAIAWISDQVDLTFTLFGLVALLAATSHAGPRSRRAIVTGVARRGARRAKEPAAMLIPVIVLVWWLEPGMRVTSRWPEALAIGVASAVYLGLRIHALGALTLAAGAGRTPVTTGTAALTGVAMFGEYVRLVALPIRLSALHDYRVVETPASPAFLAGALALAAFSWTAWRLRTTSEVPTGVALFVLPLLPALYVPVVCEGIVAERYLYMPSIGAAVLATYVLSLLPRARVIIAAIIASTFAVATVQRNAVWRDNVTLWADASQKVPDSAAVHEYYGHALLTGGDIVGATRELQRTIALKPDSPDARTNLALAFARLGRHEEALDLLRGVLVTHRKQASAYALAAWIMLQDGRIDDAIALGEQAVVLRPDPNTHDLLASAYARAGRVDIAGEHLKAAIELDPSNDTYRQHLRLVSAATPKAPVEGVDRR